MSNGKGSRPRNNSSQAFRDGWDRVFLLRKSPKALGLGQPTSLASKRLKSQGNGPSGAAGKGAKP